MGTDSVPTERSARATTWQESRRCGVITVSLRSTYGHECEWIQRLQAERNQKNTVFKNKQKLAHPCP